MNTLYHLAAGLSISLAAVSPALAEADPAPEQKAAARPELARQVMADISAERIKANIDKLVSFRTRHTLSDPRNPIKGIGAARTWLLQQLNSYNVTPAADKGKVGMMKPFPEQWEEGASDLLPGGSISNVIGAVRGKRPECENHFFYVVAHYDSRNADPFDFEGDAPGANDNASGVAAVLEIAKALAAVQLDASVVFLFTSGDEQDFLGSKYRVQQAQSQDHPIFAVLNNDIIGSAAGASDRNLVRIYSNGLDVSGSTQRVEERRKMNALNDAPARQLARYIAEIAGIEKTAVKPLLVDRTGAATETEKLDPFAEIGYAAVRVMQISDDFTGLQQASPNGKDDGAEGIDPTYIADVARLNAAVLVNLANAPTQPKRARLIAKEGETATSLRWDKNNEGDLAGYEVVWRDTGASDWQHAKDVGNVTEATLPMTRSGSFFGVRAYDKTGYKSMVSFAADAPE